MSNVRGFITTIGGVTQEAERGEGGGIRTRRSPGHAWVGVLVRRTAATFRPACPRCGRDRMRSPEARNALSRKDNKTYVCSSCGTDEAMIDMTGCADLDVWPGFPGIALHYRESEPSQP
jgi:predicted RNA-binding Zn-ribbon protein involved in translation (DUF1610 family)